MSEETEFKTMPLPAWSEDAVFFADCNVVAVREGLTCKQRQAAVTALQARWRRQHLHLVVSPAPPIPPADPYGYAIPF